MYALGFVFFCLLYIAERREKLRKYISTLLMYALAAEGYLVGFQIFVAHTVCPFCIAVASIIVGIGLLKLFGETRKPVMIGFCMFALTCSLVGSINIPLSPIPAGGQNVLIYSKTCPHCEEVIKFSKEKGIPLTLCEASEVKGVLRLIGIDAVPVLVCNDVNDKKIYTGAKNIEAVLTAKYAPPAKETSRPSTLSGTGMRPIKKEVVKKSNPKEPNYGSKESFIDLSSSGYTIKENDETCPVNKSSSKACE